MRFGGVAFDDRAFALDDQQACRVGQARGDVNGLIEVADRLQRRRPSRPAAEDQKRCDCEQSKARQVILP